MIILKIADAKLARWLCTPGLAVSAILVITGGGSFLWSIDPDAWRRV